MSTSPSNAFLFPTFVAAALLLGNVSSQSSGSAAAPLTSALLGIAHVDPWSSAGMSAANWSLQGDGSLANPYIKVQVAGFDRDVGAAMSPWQHQGEADASGNFVCSALSPVQVLTTDRRHARLLPLYRHAKTGACSTGPNCGGSLVPLPVELRQGLIAVGACQYGSLAFDVRILPNSDDAGVCPTPAYLEAYVEEVDAASGQMTYMHTLRIDRQLAQQHGMQQWHRVTFHFAFQTPGSLSRLRFVLKHATCSSVGFGGPRVYPATVDIDNIELESIPLVDRDGAGNIVSGCVSGDGKCPSIATPIGPLASFGLALTQAQHDAFAPERCPRSYCRADLDFDGMIGPVDLSFLLAQWGTLPTTDCYRRFADMDGDGQVGAADLSVLLAEWGPCP